VLSPLLSRSLAAAAEPTAPPAPLQRFIEFNCAGCHTGPAAEGGIDFDALGFDLERREVYERWMLIHDRVRAGEMPPPDDGVPVPIAPVGWSSRAASGKAAEQALSESQQMLRELAAALSEHDRQRTAAAGRAKVRRLNRYEYENMLRELLEEPWLAVS